MQIDKAEREFRYNGVKLADPDPAMTLEKVREFYSTIYPEILNAAIEGPENVANKLVYKFERAVGTKGADIVNEEAPGAIAPAAEEKTAEPESSAPAAETQAATEATKAAGDDSAALELQPSAPPGTATEMPTAAKAEKPEKLPRVSLAGVPIVIYGPAGSGKSAHAKALLQTFGRKPADLVDNWNGVGELEANQIALTNVPAQYISTHVVLIHIKVALAMAEGRGLL